MSCDQHESSDEWTTVEDTLVSDVIAVTESLKAHLAKSHITTIGSLLGATAGFLALPPAGSLFGKEIILLCEQLKSTIPGPLLASYQEFDRSPPPTGLIFPDSQEEQI